MKKAFISPLCSALVIPGLGQILNQNLKKGVFILLAVLFLFIAFVLRLWQIINSVIMTEGTTLIDFHSIAERSLKANGSFLLYLLIGFAVLWLYSVLDAYLTGRKLDQLEAGDPL